MERDDVWWMRAHLVRLMVSIAFAGGVLLGGLAGSLGLPAVFWAPGALVCCGAMWLFLRAPGGHG